VPAELLRGARYLLTGLGLLWRPRVRAFVLVPLGISAVMFTGGIWLTANWIGALTDQLMQHIPQWMAWLRYLVWPLFALLALVLVFFGFNLVANLVGAPFNGWLAEAVERHLTGSTQAPPMTWRQLPAEMGAIMGAELRKILYFALWSIPLLLLLFIPVIGPVLWFLWGAWTFACNYADYPMGNHGLKFPDQRRMLARRRTMAIGFGIASLLLTLIPLLNFLAMPASVAGMTALYLAELRPGAAPTQTQTES
jgi:CysZ protein